ncbi:hypothetical protein BZG35_09475 [Brevundimonas sp. LM2]|uniref:DUF2285 domain-containing protein n=1 Tax=Brevundimonas sp. LM2 TaxID=1938605 RepID=UPI000983B3F6|nr:DUF2285 domain-containing protein [Brevundimonas sp. LM2]AQR61855.1 hypothetical protein BZG35_09475 [Brevundimonas sp. LM2]
MPTDQPNEPDGPHALDVPTGTELTDFDRDHVKTYLRLLDAESAGADPSSVIGTVLRFPAETSEDQAVAAHSRYLQRAQWMSAEGYLPLISDSRD